jgi:hypothetical protein
MKFMLLIYDDEQSWLRLNEAGREKVFAAHHRFTEELQKRGKLLGGEALQPSTEAALVRKKEGKVVHTDGPFAETKEQLGGFYLVDANDMAEACEWAQRLPEAENGTIEVRPVMVLDA